MNFKESYKNEMNQVIRDKALDEQIFHYKKKKKEWHIIKKTFVPIIVSISLFILFCYSDEIQTLADFIYGTYSLWVGDTKINFEELKPIAFDKEGFIQDPNTVYESMYGSYYQNFDTYDTLKEVTNIQLPEHENIQYLCSVVLIAESGYGHLSIDFIYKGTQYHLNAMFLVEEVFDDSWGYGEDEKVKEVYEYAENKKAYFVSSETLQATYFSIDNILYQFYTADTSENTKIVKEILSLMGE